MEAVFATSIVSREVSASMFLLALFVPILLAIWLFDP